VERAARRAGVNPKDVAAYRAAQPSARVGFDDPAPDGRTWGETHGGEDPAPVLDRALDWQRVDVAIERLPERERETVRARLAGVPWREQAARWGCTYQRQQQVYGQAIRRLRKMLAA